LITKGTTPRAFESYGIAFIKTEAFDGTNIRNDKLAYISKSMHETTLKRSILQANDILFTIAGTIGKCVIVPEDILPANTNQALAIIRLTDKINHNYAFYLMQSKYMKNYMQRCIKGSAQPNLNLQQLNEFKIPLPPLEEQDRIVAILDRFDTLTSDITQGLPAEIEARRKQYEYYRDKLLTFKEKAV
jgi:type I restriction enzyme S subunit